MRTKKYKMGGANRKQIAQLIKKFPGITDQQAAEYINSAGGVDEAAKILLARRGGQGAKGKAAPSAKTRQVSNRGSARRASMGERKSLRKASPADLKMGARRRERKGAAQADFDPASARGRSAARAGQGLPQPEPEPEPQPDGPRARSTENLRSLMGGLLSLFTEKIPEIIEREGERERKRGNVDGESPEERLAAKQEHLQELTETFRTMYEGSQSLINEIYDLRGTEYDPDTLVYKLHAMLREEPGFEVPNLDKQIEEIEAGRFLPYDFRLKIFQGLAEQMADDGIVVQDKDLAIFANGGRRGGRRTGGRGSRESMRGRILSRKGAAPLKGAKGKLKKGSMAQSEEENLARAIKLSIEESGKQLRAASGAAGTDLEKLTTKEPLKIYSVDGIMKQELDRDVEINIFKSPETTIKIHGRGQTMCVEICPGGNDERQGDYVVVTDLIKAGADASRSAAASSRVDSREGDVVRMRRAVARRSALLGAAAGRAEAVPPAQPPPAAGRASRGTAHDLEQLLDRKLRKDKSPEDDFLIWAADTCTGVGPEVILEILEGARDTPDARDNYKGAREILLGMERTRHTGPISNEVRQEMSGRRYNAVQRQPGESMDEYEQRLAALAQDDLLQRAAAAPARAGAHQHEMPPELDHIDLNLYLEGDIDSGGEQKLNHNKLTDLEETVAPGFTTKGQIDMLSEDYLAQMRQVLELAHGVDGALRFQNEFGGTFISAPTNGQLNENILEGKKTHSITIHPNDFLIPVCKQGYNRSQVMRLVLISLENQMRGLYGEHATSDGMVAYPHGACSGCDIGSYGYCSEHRGDPKVIPDSYHTAEEVEAGRRPAGGEPISFTSVVSLRHDSGYCFDAQFNPLKSRGKMDHKLLDIAFKDAFGQKKSKRIGEDMVSKLSQEGFQYLRHPFNNYEIDVPPVIFEKRFKKAEGAADGLVGAYSENSIFGGLPEFTRRLDGTLALGPAKDIMNCVQVGNYRKFTKEWFDKYLFNVAGAGSQPLLLDHFCPEHRDGTLPPEGVNVGRRIYFCFTRDAADAICSRLCDNAAAAVEEEKTRRRQTGSPASVSEIASYAADMLGPRGENTIVVHMDFDDLVATRLRARHPTLEDLRRDLKEAYETMYRLSANILHVLSRWETV